MRARRDILRSSREARHPAVVARGLSNDEITGALIISPLTAKTHVSNISRKLDCRDRAGLVALAYQTGLITPGTDYEPETPA